jgi:uncharacterized membrane protein (UPF0127 family)
MIFELALLLAANTPAPMPTPQTLPQITVRAPRADLHLQVALTEDQRERGLMSVTKLAPHTGMIFVFVSDSPVAFWMKDTLISLDMVFVSADGSVRKIFPRVSVVSPSLPDKLIPIEQAKAKYVIELPAGEAASDGLRIGTRIDVDDVPAAQP